jgi:uncharacterized protein
MNLPLIGVGFGVGLLVGVTGLGGGALMTPILMMGFDVRPSLAVGTDLLFAAFTKLAATRIYHQNGYVDWQIARRLWWGSMPASMAALLWLHHLSVHEQDVALIKQIIAVTVVWAGMALLLQPFLLRLARRYSIGGVQDIGTFWGWVLTVSAGAILGFLVTITSVGAGALGTMILIHLYPVRLTPARLIATDMAHAIPLTLFAGVGQMLLGNVDLAMLGTLLIGSVPGALIGALLTTSLSPRLVRAILSISLLIAGAKLWWSPK